jgi:superfamily II DNA or RNA helicase
MTHPLFRKDIFVETAFERRFQAMLRSAWQRRSWHVIVADPGSGKTMGIRDLVKISGSRAILAIVTPKNNEDEQALGDQLYTALGLPLPTGCATRLQQASGEVETHFRWRTSHLCHTERVDRP